MKLSELKLAPADLTMEVMDMFYQARRDLLTFHPFCGAMSMSLQALVIRDSKMKNSCTDGKTIYLDGDFFKEATPEHRMLIIAHNVWHCALHHSSRRQKRPTQAFDYAADLEVDLILHKDGFNFQVLDHDTAWHGLSVEQLCDKLPQYIRRKLYWDTHTIEDIPIPDSLLNLPGDEEGKDKDSSDKNNEDSDEQSEEQSPRDNDSQKQSDKNPQKKDKEKAPRKDPDSDNTDDGDDDNSGDNGTGNEYDPKSRNKIGDKSLKTIEKAPKIKKVQVQDPTNTQSNNDKSATPKAEASGENGDFDGVLTAPPFPGQQWQKIVNFCTAACQGRGTLPGFMSEALELKKKNTLSWQELLREYLTMRISSNRSWTRPNRRHIHRDLYLPGILKQPDVEMVVAIDTSGSTHEYLGDFLAELHAIFSSFTNYKVTLIQCDTEINKVDEFSTAEGNLFPSGKEQKKFEFKGLGGTDLCPPFDYVKEKSSSDIQCLVYFTDGFGPTPREAPDYPVIWVLVPDGEKPAKWGEEVYIQKGEKMGNDEKIICLDIIEHIRKRPGLYIANTMGGNNMEDGVYYLLREILENSLDEIKAGYGNKIDITVRGNTFLLRDFGRGIPLESLPMVVTQAHSSGKFDHSVYQKSIGMHGLGLKIVSALSEHFYCKTIRNGQYRKLITQRGRVQEDITDIAREPDGCEIFFQPDPVIFENLQIKMLAIEKMLKKYCSANQALQVNFNGKELKCIHGLIDLLVDMVDFGTMVGEPLYLQCGDLECVISQNETASSQWFSFVNGHPTGNGGVHVDAVKSALWQASNKIMKGEHHMKPEDLFATVSGIVSVNVDNPEFEAQTKNRLGNVKLFRNWQILVQDEILNYWFSDSDQCESFFQQVDRNIEKREKDKEEYSSAKIFEEL